MDKVIEKSDEKKKYHFGKLFCIDCRYANTYDSEVCFSCGSTNLTRDKSKIKKKEIKEKKPFFKSAIFYYLISFVIAVIISIGIVFGIASASLIVRGWFAVGMVLSFAILLSFFIFVIIGVITKKEIRREPR